ncbi:MAG: rhomboid family intramembrane serine protease [Planctomycetota bacterium]
MSNDDRSRSLLEELRDHPITTILMIGATAGFLAVETGRNVDHLMLLPGSEVKEPWRFVTSLFPHFAPAQFAFNMVWVWIFGRRLEEKLGSPRFTFLTLSAAVVSGGLESALFQGPIGLSGVVFAYVSFAFVRARRDESFAPIADVEYVRLVAAWLFISMFMGWSGMLPVSNAAHFGGILVGAALGGRKEWVPPYLVVVTAGALAFAQPRLAVMTSDTWTLRLLADRALQDEDYERAVQHYEELLAAGDESVGALDRYGRALRAVGREDDMYEAWYRVLEQRPDFYHVDLAVEIKEHHERYVESQE